MTLKKSNKKSRTKAKKCHFCEKKKQDKNCCSLKIQQNKTTDTFKMCYYYTFLHTHLNQPLFFYYFFLNPCKCICDTHTYQQTRQGGTIFFNILKKHCLILHLLHFSYWPVSFIYLKIIINI